MGRGARLGPEFLGTPLVSLQFLCYKQAFRPDFTDRLSFIISAVAESAGVVESSAATTAANVAGEDDFFF